MNTTSTPPTVIPNVNPVPQPLVSSVSNTSTLKYVGFGRRLGAYLIDAVIVNLVLSPLYLIIPDFNLVNMIFLVLYTLYYVFMVGMYGATLGKMILKIRIVKEDGAKVSFVDAFIRELASYISAVVLFLGYLWVLWDPKKQSWHDKIAHTVVVRV